MFIVYIAIFIIVLFIILFLFINISNRYYLKKNIYNLFLKIIQERKMKNYKLEYKYINNQKYLIFECFTHIYYIRVLKNFKNKSVYIDENNVIYFKDKRFSRKKNKIRNINDFHNLNIDSKKEFMKILIFYPDFKSLLKFSSILEEKKLINNKFDKKTLILSYMELLRNHNYIEGR